MASTLDTHASPFQAQAVLFSVGDLPAGPHVLEVEATGTRDPASGGAWVWVDAFEAVKRTQQGDPSVALSGAWETNLLDAHSGHSAARSMQPGAKAVLHFTGTAVSWIGYRDPWSGIARVSIDGAARADIDTYAAVPAAQAVVYTLTGLPAGDHTLTLEVTGARHPLSLGEWVWVDAFDTLPE